MLTKQEESEAEVRREDQENINSFGRLNARLQEAKEEQAILKVRYERKDTIWTLVGWLIDWLIDWFDCITVVIDGKIHTIDIFAKNPCF